MNDAVASMPQQPTMTGCLGAAKEITPEEKFGLMLSTVNDLRQRIHQLESRVARHTHDANGKAVEPIMGW